MRETVWVTWQNTTHDWTRDLPCTPTVRCRSRTTAAARLTHTNRRVNGSWTQRYEHGIPVTDLIPIESDDTIGTTVHFLPNPALTAVTYLPAGFG